METQQAGGPYFYAVVPASAVPKDLGDVPGVEDTPLYAITSGELSAVVSDVPIQGELRPERKHLAAHQQVIDRMGQSSSAVLPVAFGTIADSGDGVRSLLETYQKDLSEQVKKVEGKLELGVRVTYGASKPDVFQFLLTSNPELRAARDAFAQLGREPTREEKIELGEKVDAQLSALRDEYTQRLEQALGAFAECKRKNPRNEREFVNLAVLVPADKRADVDAAVEAAAKELPDSFVVEQLGPYPAYDFVDLHLKAVQGEA